MISDDVTTPTGVDSIFVPTDGAIQFAFNKGWKYQPFVWVMPPTPRGIYQSECDCKTVYPLVLSSCGDALSKANADLFGELVVCQCQGSIIE